MGDNLVDVTPWKQVTWQDAEVTQGFGGAVVAWPSGRRTLEQYVGTAMISGMQVRQARSEAAVRAAYEENLRATLEWFRSETLKGGWWIRQRKGRKKARRISAAEWVRLSTYIGPAPDRFSMLPEAV